MQDGSLDEFFSQAGYLSQLDITAYENGISTLMVGIKSSASLNLFPAEVEEVSKA